VLLRTAFEVVADGKILHVSGARLKTWIEKGRKEWNERRGGVYHIAGDVLPLLNREG
jgi:hypothetical protein